MDVKELVVMVVIKNDYLEVHINEMGAELEKVLVNNNNILWGRNDSWKGQSPILFPICGGLKEGFYYYENQQYEMPRHGLARRRIFEVKEVQNNYAILSLKYDNESLKVYPFKFELIVKYELINKTLKSEFEIINLDDKTLLASLGIHPGFQIRALKNLLGEDLNISFESQKTNQQIFNEKGLVRDIKSKNLSLEKLEDLIAEFNENETISYEETNVKLSGLNGELNISHDMKYMVFWQGVSKDLLCIEGWDGLPDEITSCHNLKYKKDIIEIKDRIKRNFIIEIKK